MEEKWWHRSVVYQIYPKSFNDSNGDGIGDLGGIIEKLDYIQKLGVDVLWLSPIFQSPMDDNGYDISNYEAIAPEFGTMADFERLVEESDKRGIRLVMDLVVNHTSDEHPWFEESRKSKDNPKRDWYIWREGKSDGEPPNNWESWFSPSAWELDANTGEYYLHTFSVKQPDLNWKNPEVREAVYNMMHFWLKKGISGFRMDVINLIGKPADMPDAALGNEVGIRGLEHFANHSDAHMYLREMHEKVLSHQELLTVGENTNVTPYEGILYSHPDRKELSMIFQFEHMSLDNDYFLDGIKQLNLPRLKLIMTRWQEELHNRGWNSLFWSNHDQPRIVSRWGNDGIYRVPSAKMLATTLHFMQGTPYIFQGEEIGTTNNNFDSIDAHDDLFDFHKYNLLTRERGMAEELALKVINHYSRDNARVPISWEGTLDGGLTTGKSWLPLHSRREEINVQEALEDEDSIFYHYQKLISLRKSEPYSNTIVYGRHELLDPLDAKVYAFRRYDEKHNLLIVSNFTDQELERDYGYHGKKLVISNYPDLLNSNGKLKLRPFESIVLEV